MTKLISALLGLVIVQLKIGTSDAVMRIMRLQFLAFRIGLARGSGPLQVSCLIVRWCRMHIVQCSEPEHSASC